jgi:CheY-like chemotaxis protein
VRQVALIEDDEDVRDALGQLLPRHGIALTVAEHGAAALASLRERRLRPAAVVLDLWMPVMTGGEFLRAQAAEPLVAGVPVIVLTADSTLGLELPSVVRRIVHKPFLVEAVVQALERVWADRA